MTAVTLNLPEETVSRLDDFATAERRSRSNAAAVLLDRLLPSVHPREPVHATTRESISEAGHSAVGA